MLLKEQIKRNVADMKAAQSLEQEGFDVWVSDINIYIEVDSFDDIDRTRFTNLEQNPYSIYIMSAYDTKSKKQVSFSLRRESNADTI